MKRAQTLGNKLLHPPKWVRFLLPPIVFAVLIDVLVSEKIGMLAYFTYSMSAYCLVILAFSVPQRYRKIKAYLVRRLSGTAFGRNYLGDLAFRGYVSIYQGMAVNFLYVAFRLFLGIRYASVWDITLAMYYLLLGLMRLSLIVNYRNRTAKSEQRCYRRTAWLLFALNSPMCGMILLMVLTDSGYSYPGYAIYLSALYTFYTVALSVVNLVRFRKLGSPILSAAKVLNLVAALMSLLGLQTAMIAQFSSGEGNFRAKMNAATGGGVWFAVILIAVYMLLRSRNRNEVKSHESLGE